MNFPRAFGHRRHPSGIYAGRSSAPSVRQRAGETCTMTLYRTRKLKCHFLMMWIALRYCVQFAVRASVGQSSICTRATSRYLPPSGLKIEASPSLTSNQSLPRASTVLGLWVIRKLLGQASTLVPCERPVVDLLSVLLGEGQRQASAECGLSQDKRTW